eukprot:SAG22_NODE_1737_length_3688_cov_3.769852_2_plen_82_part_00
MVGELEPPKLLLLAEEEEEEEERDREKGDEEWAMFFQGRPYEKTADRVLMMERLRWDDSSAGGGWPYVAGSCPSTTPQPVP